MKYLTMRVLAIVSIAAFFVFLVGFGWTIAGPSPQSTNLKPAQSQPKTPDAATVNNKVIVALGDSLTRGTGDENGKGYIGYLVEQLEEKSKNNWNLFNYGVKGYRTDQLLAQISQKSIQEQIQKADYILITIGGNDLFQGGQAMMDLNAESISETKRSYLSNLKVIIEDLKSQNEEATIYLVGLYNPFIDLTEAAVTTDIVRQWNYETSSLLDQYANTVFVPTYDLFQLKVNDYLYTDKFHPNAKGYQLIAERVASLITW